MSQTALASPPPRRRTGRVLIRAVVFFVIVVLVLLASTQLYLVQAFRAAKDADEAQRRQLATTATLVLAVVLFVLFAGLVLTFRVSRYFFPRPPAARARPTEYVDAWAEAGRRADVPPPEQQD